MPQRSSPSTDVGKAVPDWACGAATTGVPAPVRYVRSAAVGLGADRSPPPGVGPARRKVQLRARSPSVPYPRRACLEERANTPRRCDPDESGRCCRGASRRQARVASPARRRRRHDGHRRCQLGSTKESARHAHRPHAPHLDVTHHHVTHHRVVLSPSPPAEGRWSSTTPRSMSNCSARSWWARRVAPVAHEVMPLGSRRGPSRGHGTCDTRRRTRRRGDDGCFGSRRTSQAACHRSGSTRAHRGGRCSLAPGFGRSEAPVTGSTGLFGSTDRSRRPGFDCCSSDSRYTVEARRRRSTRIAGRSGSGRGACGAGET